MSNEDWKLIKLGDVLTRRKDFTPIEVGTEYSISGVQRSGWGLVEKDPVKSETTNFKKLLKLNEGNFVYRTITAYEAPSTVVGADFSGTYVTPQAFPVFIVDEDEVSSDYLKLITTWGDFHFEMASRCVGTVLRRKTLSVNALNEIPLSLPPLDTQRQIVAVMQSTDQAISDQETHVKATEKVRENVVESLWEDTGKLFKLKELGKTMTGATPSSKDETNWGSNEIPFVTPRDLSFGGAEITEFGTERFASQSAFDKSTRKIDGYAVAQVCIGSSIGKAGYFTGSKLFNQQINIVNGLNLEDARLLTALLSTSKIQNELRSITGVTAVPIINKTKWSEIEVPWGDEQSRQESSELLAGIDSHLADARHQLESMRKLRGEVLNALLSGEHEIPADFDPAMRQLNSEEI